MTASDANPIVFGDSLAAGAASSGGFQSYAQGGQPSGWILSSIKGNSEVADRGVLLSTGASNDSLNAVAIWARKLPEPRALTNDEIEEIKRSPAYKQFKENARHQIETLMAHGVRAIFVMGVEDGPANAPDYVRHKHDPTKTVAYVAGGVFKALGVNADLAQIVADYKIAHPDQASRIAFGGPATRPDVDKIHPSDAGYRKIVMDSHSFFQNGAVPSAAAGSVDQHARPSVAPATGVRPPDRPAASAANAAPPNSSAAETAVTSHTGERPHGGADRTAKRHRRARLLRTEHFASTPDAALNVAARQSAPVKVEDWSKIEASAVPYTQLAGHQEGRTVDHITGKPPQRKPVSPAAGK